MIKFENSHKAKNLQIIWLTNYANVTKSVLRNQGVARIFPQKIRKIKLLDIYVVFIQEPYLKTPETRF